MWGVIIRDRRERNNGLDQPRDFLDVLIANGFTDEQIVILISELFGAGTESVSITIEWAMTELLMNKDAMEKLSQELKTQTTTDSIKESDLSKLPYLHACVKETLRIHAPTPFLIPHRALDTCKVLNYTIPKNSQVLVNVWAIGRDSTVWEDPLRFKPERFLSSDIDFKGHDFEFLPFGSGRRQCPGLALASKQVHLILASLISSFHWCLPNGEDPSKIDVNESFGVTLQKEQPLLVIPMRKK
ncbi:probable (S)-N-methylcoclaurine 3'-hydroxylase isozyme 2 [Diospyros lotus]|uniref:probable (S)-N-methylcoclaurine 3'-hydroxylase isozyme 2 n=1 Tax=Diospyros lotus TaxID=55363 RepID=UPI0022529261|nr:probable (S)-N-methylcoclaurine 3'-hydroxylase isozyme 2 [Diospyros lotus]